jgi:hypothetical protein
MGGSRIPQEASTFPLNYTVSNSGRQYSLGKLQISNFLRVDIFKKKYAIEHSVCNAF